MPARKLGIALASVALLAAGLAAFVFADGGGERRSCGDLAGELALVPAGEGSSAFTMGLRVNEPSDVAELKQELGDRVLPRDVFVVNTEHPSSSPDTWAQSVDELEDAFPCNRVAALTGLGSNAEKPGFAHALVDDDRVDAYLLDWEPDTWADAGAGAWTPALGENLRRMDARLAELVQRIGDDQKHIGLVPDYLASWDYGAVARTLALRAFEIGPEHRGYQIVQTQPDCGDSAEGIGEAAAAIRRQYRPLFGFAPTAQGWRNVPGDSDVIVRHLAFELAFSTTPNPRASEAVERVGPEQAARCSAEVLEAGGAGILYWADAASLKAMLDTPQGQRLRPESR